MNTHVRMAHLGPLLKITPERIRKQQVRAYAPLKNTSRAVNRVNRAATKPCALFWPKRWDHSASENDPDMSLLDDVRATEVLPAGRSHLLSCSIMTSLLPTPSLAHHGVPLNALREDAEGTGSDDSV